MKKKKLSNEKWLINIIHQNCLVAYMLNGPCNIDSPILSINGEKNGFLFKNIFFTKRQFFKSNWPF